MGLSDNCQEILCGIAVAGGAIAATTLGIPLATGVVELVTGGGNLALAVNREQQDRCEKLLRDVKKRVAKDFNTWIKSEFHNDEAAKADIEAAFEELDRVLPLIKPTPAEVVEAGFIAETLYQRIKTRLPDRSLFRTNQNAERVLRTVITNTYALVRGDAAFSATLTSFGFERVISDLQELGLKADSILDAVERQRLENQLVHHRSEDNAERRHKQAMDSVISNTGLPVRIIEDLFKSVEMEFPESDLEAKVYEALDRIKELAEQKIAPRNLGDDVRMIFEAANRKLEETKDVGAASAILDPLIDNAEHAMLAAAQASNQQALMYAAVYRFDEAIAAYEKAARYNPENYYYWGQIGDIRVHRGNLTDALDAFNRALEIASAQASERDVSVCHERIGDIRTAQGDLTGALDAYKTRLGIMETLTNADPGNTEWQRDLSISHEKIGDIRTAQGNLTGALDAYQASLDIRKTLAGAGPGNTQWQHDLSVSHLKIGDIRTAQGDLEGAHKAYKAARDIAQTLANADPGNTQWQRGLSISHERIGDILIAQDNLTDALEAYKTRLGIMETLANADPGNTQWQRDLIISHVKLAVAGGEAASHYRKALDIAEWLEAEGKLAPVDVWMVDDLRVRLKTAE